MGSLEFGRELYMPTSASAKGIDAMTDKAIECPRCNEADERSVGMNRCGLCECEFFVASNGAVYAPRRRPLPPPPGKEG